MNSQEIKILFARTVAEEARNVKPTVEADAGLPDFDGARTTAQKVEALMSRLTRGEKIDLLSGIDNMAIKGVARLSMPRVWNSDATSGVRNFGMGTAFPASIALTASWNRELVGDIAGAIGDECRATGVSILLGPGLNMYRVPTNGRNFEYMGEDPFLAGEMAVSYVKAVQGRGVMATVKHFACNNSEYDRHRMNSVVDERTLHEIYLEAFRRAVVKGGAMAVMTSYNLINGVRASENAYLLMDVLRGQWGFTGLIMSDWNAVYSVEDTIKGGLDLEMPGGRFLNRDTIGLLLREGRLSEEDVDGHVRRILGTVIEIGAYERPVVDASRQCRTKAHRLLARRAAEESVVLLKNEDDLLPLVPGRIRMIAVIGPNSRDTPTGGGGASYVEAEDSVSILEGLEREFGGVVQVLHVEDAAGCFSEADASVIRKADAVVACVGYNHVIESECYDRSWRLPDAQEELIRSACRLNPRTVVVVNAGGDYETESWLKRVPVLLQIFYLGVEGGSAVARIVSGRVNPSGKLPFTFARQWRDHPATGNYPKAPENTTQVLFSGPDVRVNGDSYSIKKRMSLRQEKWDIRYAEGIFHGYRFFDAYGVQPLFPFGFGLSYTRFELSHPEIKEKRVNAGEPVTLSISMRNTGSRVGLEVVQVYVRDVQSRLPRPRHELKQFAKVALDPVEEKRIELTIEPDAFRFYDADEHRWVMEPGEFEILVGTSSRALQSAGTVELGHACAEYLKGAAS